MEIELKKKKDCSSEMKGLNPSNENSEKKRAVIFVFHFLIQNESIQ